MSSRNRRLSLKQRAFAPYIYKALLAAQQSIACGERYAAVIKCRAAAVPQHAAEIKLEYLELVDPETIRPMDVVKAPVRAALAAWIGETRLIDNVFCEPSLAVANSRSSNFVAKRPTKPSSSRLFLNVGTELEFGTPEGKGKTGT
jgi:hypothetical protein